MNPTRPTSIPIKFLLRLLATSFFLLVLILDASAQQSVPTPSKRWSWMEDSLSGDIHAYKGQQLIRGGALVEACKAFVRSEFSEFQDPRSGLELVTLRSSPVGKHVTFRQTFNGVPIYGTDIKFNLRKGRLISSLFKTVLHTSSWQSMEFPEWKHGLLEAQYVIFYNEGSAQGGFYYEVHQDHANAYYKVIELVDGSEYVKDIARHVHGPVDSLVWAYVFDPDPLTKAQRVYGGQLQNFKDGDTDSLTAMRELVQVDVKYEEDSFWLENEYVKFVSGSHANFTAPHGVTDTFDYTRSQDEFEYVNVLYHISEYRDYLKSLGYDSLANYQIEIDPRAFLDDNSSFVRKLNTEGHGELKFGYSDTTYQHVDDAEDADVIIHEFGHAISYHANENSLDGAVREAIDEGLGDYLACGYSSRISNYRSEYLFSWDGHNPFWEEGRNCYTDRMVSDYKGRNGKYINGEIFAGMMSNVSNAVGYEAADKMLFTALYEFDNRMSFEDVGLLLMDAESALYKGLYEDTLCHILSEHEFLTEDRACESGLRNDLEAKSGFFVDRALFKQTGGLNVTFYKPTQGRLSLYDMNGRLIHQADLQNSIEHKDLIYCESGVYLLKVEMGLMTKVERIVR